MSDFCIAVAGNPNCGKTALFNALTGMKQRVGNWPGVTVEKKTGQMCLENKDIEVTDIPGTYTLNIARQDQALDQKIANDYLLKNKVDCIVNVIDGANLERNLYLTMQLMELNVPMIIAVNMMDIVKKRGISLDLKKMSEALGCPVVPLIANRKRNGGLKALKQTIAARLNIRQIKANSPQKAGQARPDYSFPELMQKAITDITNLIKPDLNKNLLLGIAIRVLESDSYAQSFIKHGSEDKAAAIIKNLESQSSLDADIFVADLRYQFIRKLVSKVCLRPVNPPKTITHKIDRIVLNRFLGIPVFLGVMYLMFVFAINVGGAFQDFFDIGSTALLVDGLSSFLVSIHCPLWLVALLAHGLGKGINTTLTFAPVIGGMFLFLSFLEDSGYMARAAFVVDRLMRALGLPGRSFVPMIVGFGCNVPAVMGARSIANKRDRILTVMMAPFMSCGARLAIFAVFVSVFFPHHGQNIVFLLYLLGILVAVLTGVIMRNTILPGNPAPLVMELPPYHRPQLKEILRHAWRRLSTFLLRAGRYIIPVCMLLGLLNSISLNGELLKGEANNKSVLSTIGKTITPVFYPMGITQENWPATVGLFTGVLAKEVVVGSLNTLYSQKAQKNNANLNKSVPSTLSIITNGLTAALQSIPDNLSALPAALLNPVAASEAPHEMNSGAQHTMHLLFATQAAAFAYLIFVLLYFPCVSTMAAVRRELGSAWSWFGMLWSTAVAYAVAVFYFQLSQFFVHPQSSLLCVLIILASSIMICLGLRYFAKTSSLSLVNNFEKIKG